MKFLHTLVGSAEFPSVCSSTEINNSRNPKCLADLDLYTYSNNQTNQFRFVTIKRFYSSGSNPWNFKRDLPTTEQNSEIIWFEPCKLDWLYSNWDQKSQLDLQSTSYTYFNISSQNKQDTKCLTDNHCRSRLLSTMEGEKMESYQIGEIARRECFWWILLDFSIYRRYRYVRGKSNPQLQYICVWAQTRGPLALSNFDVPLLFYGACLVRFGLWLRSCILMITWFGESYLFFFCTRNKDSVAK